MGTSYISDGISSDFSMRICGDSPVKLVRSLLKHAKSQFNKEPIYRGWPKTLKMAMNACFSIGPIERFRCYGGQLMLDKHRFYCAINTRIQGEFFQKYVFLRMDTLLNDW